MSFAAATSRPHSPSLLAQVGGFVAVDGVCGVVSSILWWRRSLLLKGVARA